MNETNEQRAERLKAALRDNLKRRKEQARGRAARLEPDPGTHSAASGTIDPVSDKTSG